MNDLVIRTENLTKVYVEPIDFIVPMQPAFYNGKSRTHGNGGECAELGTASISLYPFSYWDGNCVHGIVGIYLSETGGVMR